MSSKMNAIPLFYVNLAFIAGILLQKTGLTTGWVITLIVISLIMLWHPVYYRRTEWVCLGMIMIFGLGLARLQELNQDYRFAVLQPYENREIKTKGVVNNIFRTKSGKYRYGAILYQIQTDTVRLPTAIGYFVYSRDSLSLLPGDTIRARGTWKFYPVATNPGQFNVRKYYRRKGIYGMLLPHDTTAITLRPGAAWSIARMVYLLRQKIKLTLNNHLDGYSAGLLSALLLGDRSALDPELYQRFRTIGVVHVLAVSGLHVGYILAILTILMSVLRIPWGYDRIGIIAGLGLFAALTGFTPSVSRAAFMAALYILAPVLNRTANPWNILSTASWFLLIIDPGQLFQTGFILSFTAVAAIIFFYNELNRHIPERFRVQNIKSQPVKYLWALFLVSLSAQVGTLPVTLYLFHTFPAMGLVANLFIVPLIGVIVASGILLLVVSCLPVISGWIGNAIWLFTQLVSWLSTVFSRLPVASLPVHRFTGWHMAYYILGLSSVIFILRRDIRRLGLVLLLIIPLFIWQWALLPVSPRVYFLDVGQGDCSILRWPNGKTMVIDAGFRYRNRDMGRDIVLPALQSLGCTRIQWLVLTHPHNDHLGGMKTLLRQIPVDTVITFQSDYGSLTYRSTLALIDSLGIVLCYTEPGMQIRLDRKSIITVLWPPADHAAYSLNNASVVLQLNHGNIRCLFTGDLEYQGERALLEVHPDLRSQILKIGHHGSITSTSEEFLTRVAPDFAVISVAEKNKFGHPSPVTLQRLQYHEVTTFETDQTGAVMFDLVGPGLRYKTWK